LYNIYSYWFLKVAQKLETTFHGTSLAINSGSEKVRGGMA